MRIIEGWRLEFAWPWCELEDSRLWFDLAREEPTLALSHSCAHGYPHPSPISPEGTTTFNATLTHGD